MRLFRRWTGPSVSVVVNTINRAESLRRTLTALTALDHPAYEVVVVNGPSADHTEQVVRDFGAAVRLVACPQASLGVSRNLGVDAAAGDVVAFVDDDAVPRPDWLTHLTRPYRDPGVGGVGGPVFDVPLGRVDWKVCTCTRAGQPSTDRDAWDDALVRPGADPFAYLPGCNMSYRRDVLAAVGGFDEDLARLFDDVDVARAVIDAGHRLVLVDEAVVRHDRAVNDMRDGRQVLLDPYHVVHARAVFASRCAGTPIDDELTAALRGWADTWCAAAANQAADGLLTDAELERFVARAHEGLAQGLDDGARPRRHREIAPRPPVAGRRRGQPVS